MIAELKPRTVRKRSRAKTIPAWHKQYMAMLPAIVRYARFASRDLDADAREEFMQEVVANTLAAFVRLVELGKAEIAYATPLAIYAVAQIRAGRQVGAPLNVRDVSSDYCQMQKNVAMKRLDHYDRQEGGWLEVLIEDRHTGPAETAASRIDFPAWLKTLSRRKRRIAWKLALGETTGKVARLFSLSAGRISQMRRELEYSWLQFHGEPAAA
ncbi:MAG: hypothetical protein RBS80_28590 [Thermoguttaceae bacterium]|jgi:hypothetical protein|nr:hypothetical protein [Thermoguttaceae bacterium]